MLISVPYCLYVFKYYIFYLPILFIISFTMLITTIFKGNSISLIISNVIYLFSLTIFNILLTHNIKIVSYTFLPYLDMSYYIDPNNYSLNNIIYGINTNISYSFLILAVYSIVFILISLLFYYKDVD